MHAFPSSLLLGSVISFAVANPIDLAKRDDPCSLFINEDNPQANPGSLVTNCMVDDSGASILALVANPGYTGRTRVTQADYGDASGSLPDGTMFSQAVSYMSGTSTTFTASIGLNAGYQQDGISSGLTASVGYSVTVSESTTETETITIKVECPNGGIVQYQPLYAAIDGDFTEVQGGRVFGYVSQSNYTGSYLTPQTGQSNFQLTNYRVTCN